jgi:sorbitol/mannitol transport system substrate-binding protein
MRSLRNIVSRLGDRSEIFERAPPAFDSRLRGSCTLKPYRSFAAATVLGAFAVSGLVYHPVRAVADDETITIASVNNPQMIDMQHAVGDFTKKTGIKVNFVTLPENTLRQKVTADVATGGGQFDVATVGTYEVPNWAKNKWIDDLAPLFSKMDAADRADYALDDVLPNIRKGLSYQGDLYAVPFYGESSMTFYNKKEFSDAHLSMPMHPTWDQIEGFAKKLNDPAKNQYGICLRGLPGWGEMGAPMTTVINTFGGSWFDMAWQPQLTTAPTDTAIAFYINLIKQYGEPGATSSGFTECETDFSQGKVGIWVDATSASGEITDPKDSKVAADVGFAFSPTKVTPLGSHWLWAWSLALESSSKHKEAAFKFMTWATNKKYIRLIAASKGWGNVPPGTRLSTFQDPSYKKAVPYGDIILASIQSADPTHSTLHKVPYVGVQFVGIPEFQQIGTTVTQNLAQALSGSATVDQQLQLSQTQVVRTMTQAGYIK